MTTPEEQLRALLQAEAEDLVPAGDGLRVIADRLAQRRSLSARLRPIVAISAVVGVAAAAAVTVSLTDSASLRPAEHRPPRVTSPGPTGCTEGLCAAPKPSPTLVATGVTTSSGGIPVWPFTTDAEAADWVARPGARGWAADPVQVTQHLLDDLLKLPGSATSRLDTGDDVATVEVSAGGRPVSQVRLVRVGRDDRGPWSVTGAASDDLAVTAPESGAQISSPQRVTGTATAGPVRLQLLDPSPVAGGGASAGNNSGWSTTLTWTRSSWTLAALVASTVDGNGDLSAVTLTAVRSSDEALPTGLSAGAAFVAVDQETIVVVDAATGQKVRQLSYPGNGAIDVSPDRGGEDGVVWVRIEGDACTSSILRAGLVHGPSGVTVDAKPIGRSLPSLSSGGRSLGWFEQPCASDVGKTVVVRGPDARFTTVAHTTHGINDLDVRDDGWAAVQQDERVLLLAPGSTDVARGIPLAAGDGCLVTAPAWDGPAVLAWEQCGGRWTIGRWSTSGALLSRGPDVPDMSRVLHFAVSGNERLVALDNYRIARVAGDRLVDLPNALRWRQPDW